MDNALFIGSKWILLDETDSTNTFALNLLQNSAAAVLPPEGTVIMAKRQTAGRGMRGNKWHDNIADMGLAMSVVLYPTFLPLKHQFFLSQAVALAVCQTINDISGQKVSCQIKWPNDIYVNSSKLGGVLIENNLQNGIWASAVVGIGLNINHSQFPDFLPNPVSLYQLTGTRYDITTIAKKLCHYLEKWYLMLKTDKLSGIKAAYLQNLCRYRQYARYRSGDSEIVAQITDIAENGFLQLQIQPDGKEKLFDIKELIYIF